jgi:hypothetical protein
MTLSTEGAIVLIGGPMLALAITEAVEYARRRKARRREANRVMASGFKQLRKEHARFKPRQLL